MAKVCQVTGKSQCLEIMSPMPIIKQGEDFLPNLQTKNFGLKVKKRWVRLRVSAKGLRIIDKNGIDSVLKRI